MILLFCADRMRPPCRNGSHPRLDYFAFFCKASKLVSKTLYENFVELRQSVAKAGASSAETAESRAELISTYITKVRKHASQPDAKELARIVYSWERNGAMGEDSELSAVRIICKMHQNHCHFLQVSGMAASALLHRSSPAAGAAGQHASDAPAAVLSRCAGGALTFPLAPALVCGKRAQLVLLIAEAEMDAGRGLDASVLWPVSHWDWTPEIDSFFDLICSSSA